MKNIERALLKALKLHLLRKMTTLKIVICVSKPESTFFSSESEFSGRGAAEA
jgi:hypothetical protein